MEDLSRGLYARKSYMKETKNFKERKVGFGGVKEVGDRQVAKQKIPY